MDAAYPPPPPPAAEQPSVRIDPSVAAIKGVRDIDIEIFVTVDLNKLPGKLELRAMHLEPKLSNEPLRIQTYVSNPGLGLGYNPMLLSRGLREPEFFEPLFGTDWTVLLKRTQSDDAAIFDKTLIVGARISYNHFCRTVIANSFASVSAIERAYNETVQYAENTLRDVGALGMFSNTVRLLNNIAECQNGLAGAAFDNTGAPWMKTLLELAQHQMNGSDGRKP